ncbi:unnamed protein product [Ilex paraguariensis]|uniref:Protein ENHANCED DISEASE RESISTANCE 2 C-terminal domain-containing protein n=1 Tax=Ilex paraguariensis TaxID=185542 RepID=A0ABC8TAR7_9AQUA
MYSQDIHHPKLSSAAGFVKKLHDLAVHKRGYVDLQEMARADGLSCNYGTTLPKDPTWNLPCSWIAADPSTFLIRGKTYLEDHKKIKAKGSLMQMVAADWLRSDKREDDLGGRPGSIVQKYAAKGGPEFFFIVNIQVPGSTTYSLALYYMMGTPVEDTPLLESFIGGDDAHRNSRFKLIPYISKIKAKGSLMQMVAADWLRSDKREDDLGGRPGSIVQKYAAKGGPEFFFIVNIQVPGSTTYSLALYYMMGTPVEDTPLLESFIEGDDAHRNSRFKLIPYISKIKAKGSLMQMVAADWLRSDKREDDLGGRPGSIVQKYAAKGGPEFFFIVNIQVPGSTTYSLALYYMMGTPVEDTPLLESFIEGDDAHRNSRFKLIPYISKGSWIVKQSVGKKACLVGQALEINYFRGKNYLELGIDIGSSTVARGVVSLVLGYLNNLVIEMAFLIQGSWIVKQSVGKKACLVGQALEINYFRGKNYLELGIDIGSSTVARGVVSLVLGYLNNLVIEMAFLIQANTTEELPECLLGTCRLNHLDASKSILEENSFVNTNDDLYSRSSFFGIQGSWIVKQSVGKKACLVGQALEINYFRGKNYLELGIDIGSSTVARGVVSLVLGYLNNLVIEMAFLIQANTTEELPECLLGTCRLNHLDASKSILVQP